MSDYVIVTDSTADLSADMYDDLLVDVIPMEFIVDGKVYKHYKDAHKLSVSDFYKKVKTGSSVSTSQINPTTYHDVFVDILKSGKDILYLCLSSGLSGTYQGSKIVIDDLKRQFPKRRIESVDTLCASIGEGLLVYTAAKLKKSGKTLDEVMKWVFENRLNVAHLFVVDDLEFLKKGGRITGFQANVGTLLNLKPMLAVNDEGKLIPVSKQRGNKKVIDEFIKRLLNDGDRLEEQVVMVGHADNIEFAMIIADEIKKLAVVKDVVINEIGPIIGCHVGPGMTALTFFGRRNLNK